MGVRRVFGRYLEGVWRVSGRCLEGVWKVSEKCLEGVWKAPNGPVWPRFGPGRYLVVSECYLD